MYSQLIGAALDLAQDSDGQPTTSAALANLLRCRVQLGEDPGSDGGLEGVYGSVADHLAYDVALMELARLLGVECDASEFDRPETARARLERILTGRGIRLDDTQEQPTPSADQMGDSPCTSAP
jgi:hypothetical protein